MTDNEQPAGWHGPPSPAEIQEVVRRISIYGANSADLDVIRPPNRWAAFTDDELEVLGAWCAFFDTAKVRHGIQTADDTLTAQVTDELKRRRRT